MYINPERYKKEQELAILMNAGTVIQLKADVFLRGNTRKPKELFKNYRRGLRNAKKALKVRLKHGPDAVVLLNKKTMCVL